MSETDAIRLQTFCSVYERSDDPEWQERAKAVRRLLARVRELEEALRAIERNLDLAESVLLLLGPRWFPPTRKQPKGGDASSA